MLIYINVCLIFDGDPRRPSDFFLEQMKRVIHSFGSYVGSSSIIDELTIHADRADRNEASISKKNIQESLIKEACPLN